MPIVAFTDPQGALGRRLSALANDQGAMNGDEPLEFRPLDGLQPAELDAALKGADVLAHLLASTPGTPTGATTDVSTTRRVLEAATRAGVDHVVLVSDATVYGAWANNPVPLTDDAVVRPNP